MGASRPRQWAVAAGVSIAAHLIVFLGVLLGVEHRLPPPAPPAFSVMLERPPPPVENESPKPPPPPPPPIRLRPTPPPPAPAPAPQPAPTPAPQIAAPTFSSIGGSGRGLGPAPKIGVVGSTGTALQMECLGKDLEKLAQRERLACEQQIYAYIDSRHGAPIDPALDPTKRANYEAALARKRDRAAPVSRLGNASQSGCLGSNMGVGCIGENTLPLVSTGDAADKFREGARTTTGR